MSEDSFSEITRDSWFSRIGNSLKGIVFGIIMFIIAFPVLFFNEGRAVKTYKTLNEGAKAVVPIDSGIVNSSNDGKLVHLTGMVLTEEVLQDGQFGVSANAIKLVRNVEMYQWKETKKTKTKKKTGGSSKKITTYSYEKVWLNNLINSDSFKNPQEHDNPKEMTYQKKSQIAKQVKLGEFELSKGLIGSMSGYENLELDDSSGIPEDITSKMKVHEGQFYCGIDPLSPSIGDVRIGFRVVKPGVFSVISKQISSTFEPYYAKTGKKIEMIKAGTFSPVAMFEDAKQANVLLTWILRFVGFILMLIGVAMILGPLAVLADVIPFLGGLVGSAIFFVAFLVAGACSLSVIAVSWIVFRPVLGVILLVCAAALTYLIRNFLGRKKNQALSLEAVD